MLRFALPLLLLVPALLPAQNYRPFVATFREVSVAAGQQPKVMMTRVEAQDSKGSRYTKDVTAARGDSRITLVTAGGLYVQAFENAHVKTSMQRTPAEHAERRSGLPDPATGCLAPFSKQPPLPGTEMSIAGREQHSGVEVVKLVPASPQQTRMVLWRAPALDCVTLRREMTFGGNANPASTTRLELVTLSLTEDPALFQSPKLQEVTPSEFHTAIARFFGGEPNEMVKGRFAAMDKAYQEQRKRK